jgi:hypothetical protein
MLPIVSGFFKTEEVSGGCVPSFYQTSTSSSVIDMRPATGIWIKIGYIIPASDFSSAAGSRRTISAIKLRFGNISNVSNYTTKFEIYMKNTSASTVSAGSGQNISSDSANYSGASGITAGVQNTDITYNLTTPFVWDGTSNIMIVSFGTAVSNSSDGWCVTPNTGKSWRAYSGNNEAGVRSTELESGTLAGTQEWYLYMDFTC